MTPRSLLLLAPLALSLAACQQEKQAVPEGVASGRASGAVEAKPGLSLSAGKLVLPAVAGNPGAAYFALLNNSGKTVSLAAVSIEGAGKAEMHQTQGGSMTPVDRVDVEPGVSIAFEPGKLHVMAFDLAESIKAGGNAEMTLTFTDGDKLSAPLSVEAAGGGGHEH